MTAIESLTEKLRSLLKAARLVATPLPLTPPIQLYLLEKDYPQGALTPEERQALMDKPPYWVFAWSSGQVLARWIFDCPESVAGKRVLDFGAGAGAGAVAIAAALCGAREVIALDLDSLSCQAVSANAALNRVAVETAQSMASVSGNFDVLFAADVLYDKENLPLLEVFCKCAQRVVVADSRVKELPEPYRRTGRGLAVTLPDLEEPDEFRHVQIFSYPADVTTN